MILCAPAGSVVAVDVVAGGEPGPGGDQAEDCRLLIITSIIISSIIMIIMIIMSMITNIRIIITNIIIIITGGSSIYCLPYFPEP